ncbi:MAG: preprotein translocase subunit SecA [Parcubacteria group bacterium]
MLFNLFSRSNGPKDKVLLQKVNDFEEQIRVLNDEAMREKSQELRKRASSSESLIELLPEAFALVRETAKRTLGQRHFDTQILGGINIHKGAIVEMMTGEGKTLAVTAPAYLNALPGKGVHIITVNDYLATRDAVWMGQIYQFLGLSTACLTHENAFIYDPDFNSDLAISKKEEEADKRRDETGSFLVEHKFLRPIPRDQAYLADITYGTNHEFGFDYLRDNLAPNKEVQVQRGYNFAVIDEVDSILIDEARTPLIISAPDIASSEYYKVMWRAVSGLNVNEDYTVDEKLKSVSILPSGIDKVEKSAGVPDLYGAENMRLAHYLDECLKAKALFLRDRDYVVQKGEVIIVDQFTGRLMHGRRYSGGLHQAIEAKEGVKVQDESKTFAQITIQNYFRLYEKISGMTGTAQTSAEEFHKVYGVETVTIPTNKPIVRKDLSDLIYKTADAKFKAVAEDAKKRSEKGQPVLIGTVSIEKNELLAGYLTQAGVKYEMLNAKNHEKEGQVIAQAGRKGAVTLATNMAGRGVDIILGGSPYDEKLAKEVKEFGGLHVIGTERHEARRIDNQLRGRSGRQGDPGSSQFFVSLEDDLMRIFGGERIRAMMQTLNIPEDMPIESGLVTKALVSAQKKVEGLNFDARKHLLDYDDVLNKQRISVYHKRQHILQSTSDEIKELIMGVITERGKTDSSSQNPGEVNSPQSEANRIKEMLDKIENLEVFKRPLLAVLDMLWMNHLEDLESLRESVRIRAYGQHDPLVEYRRESHILYRRMLETFDTWVYENISKIRIVSKEEAELQRKPMGQVAAELNMRPEELAKVGRNDPCPCGAKKEDGTPVKFKHCHGK